MTQITAVHKERSQISRPLKVLIPLIQSEIEEGNEAGLEHYRRAGEMLIEAKDQVTHGNWSKWLSSNFELSQTTAWRYMKLARRASVDDLKFSAGEQNAGGITAAIGHKHSKNYSIKNGFKPLFEAVDRLTITRLAEERQSREDEIKLHRDIALKLIDLGYRAMATRLHPDRGGSKDAMMRLNTVRDELKDLAAIRRYI